MTVEDIEKLKEETSDLRQIYEKTTPIKSDGSFNMDEVKKVTLEMIDYIFTDSDQGDLLKHWMDTHEFWVSPASTKFHGNIKGGLAAHSLLVAYQAIFYSVAFAENFMQSKNSALYTYTASDVFIAGLCHDFCKAGSYSTEYRKTKDYSGNSVYSSFYKTKSGSRNLGHGNESVLQVLEIMPELIHKRYLIEAISRHMGFSDLSEMEKINYSVFLQNPLVLLLQMADQTAASWWDV